MAFSRRSVIIFCLSLFTLIYWAVGMLANVYKWAFTGAVYELLWLPMAASIFILPVLSLILWIRNKFSFRSLYLYSLLISLAAAFFIFRQISTIHY